MNFIKVYCFKNYLSAGKNKININHIVILCRLLAINTLNDSRMRQAPPSESACMLDKPALCAAWPLYS